LLILGVLSGCAGAGTPASAESTITEDQVLGSLGFEPERKEALLQGEVIVRDIAAIAENDVGVALALVVPASPADVMDFLRSPEGARIDSSVLEFKELAGEPREQDFKGVDFTGEEISELESLFDAEEGYGLNLGAGEIEQMSALRKKFPDSTPDSDRACADAVIRAYRGMLLERCKAYESGGLDRVEGYARGEATSQPGKEIRLAIEKDKLLAERCPDFQKAILSYPKEPRKGVDARLYWSKETIDGRPGIILGHRMLYRLRDGALLAERQIYVAHSYNSLYSVTGVIPWRKGSLVFCDTRMFTDEIVGFGSTLRHAIAANEMQSALQGQFSNLGPMLEKWLKAREPGKPAPDPVKGK
jgi:hypothetical protein